MNERDDADPDRSGRSIEYDKRNAPVTAGEVRALAKLADDGRLPGGVVTPEILKRLIDCVHTNAPRPCARCLGYADEREMAAEEGWHGMKKLAAMHEFLRRIREHTEQPVPLASFDHPAIPPNEDWRSDDRSAPWGHALMVVGAEATALQSSPLHLVVGCYAEADWITQKGFGVFVPPRQLYSLWLCRTPAGDMLRGDADDRYESGTVTLWGWRIDAPEAKP